MPPPKALSRVIAPPRNQATTSALRKIIRDYLEDPFITPAKAPQPAVPTIISFGGIEANLMGSLDFDYEFPRKLAAYRGAGLNEQPSEMISQQLIIQRERERLDMIRRGINPQ